MSARSVTADAAPMSWGYVASGLGAIALVLALIVLVGWALDRLAGLYDERTTTASGRRRSVAPDERPWPVLR